MGRIVFAVIIVGGLVLTSICFGYSGGSGTAQEPYQIATKADLLTLAGTTADYNKCFIMTADINMGGQEFTTAIIAADTSPGSNFQGTPFTGVFDGNSHKIANFTINGGYNDYLGLFGFISGGSVKNLGLENCDVNGSYDSECVGSLAGLNRGSISDCYSTGTVSADTDTGGLCGRNEQGSIVNCYSTGNVSGNRSIGGLCGVNEEGSINGNITGCYSTGNVTGSGSNKGGLCGYNGGNVTNCYSTGLVTGDRNVSGLCGFNRGSVTNCYSTGNIIGNIYTGGLCGVNSDGIISNCYSTGNVTGNSYTGGLCGGTSGSITDCYSTGTVTGGGYDTGGLCGENLYGSITSCYFLDTAGPDNGAGVPLTDEHMKQQENFVGWDFVGEVVNGPNDIWKICEGECYPQLWYEKYGGGLGDANNPYLIYTSCQMNAIGADANDWDKHFKLMADIDLSAYTGTSFNIIGNSSNPFTGVFDGNGHSISNFSYDSPETSRLGLFGYVDDPDAEIKNVGLIAADVNAGTGPPRDAGSCVGALVGHLEYGSITGCYVTNSKVCGGQGIGGLAGLNSFGEIEDCNSVSTIVIGYEEVGGLIGNTGGSISNCYSRDTSVSGGEMSSGIGGLTGHNEGTISECYTRGSVVTGEMGIGGFAGRNKNTGIISSCYSEDTTVAGPDAGGLCGINYGGTISNCHSDCFVIGGGGLVGEGGSNISNCYSVSRCIGSEWSVEGDADCFWNYETAGVGFNIGIDLSTAEMMTEEVYVISGWDFTTPIWTIDEGKDYPRLWWEKTDSPGRYGGGRGLPAEPYLIYTAEEMQEIGANRIDWHKHSS